MGKIIDAIVKFLAEVGKVFTVELVGAISIGLIAIAIIISAIVASNSVENKTNKKVKQINAYLLRNPFVNDENIVEFNRIMKHRMPRAMRYQWQKYMVNRNDKPSTYLSEDNCITKPFRTSAFVQVLKQFKYIVGFLLITTFTFLLGANLSATELTDVASVILSPAIIMIILLLAYVIFLFLMNAKRNAILNDLFYNFDAMQHAIDRAVITFPAFVDYEILFTKKEIAAGIPVLQEYLQQRAQYEQEQLEKARLSQVEHEKYDFSKLGGKGTMIMERAMKECEFYLGNRKTLLADIDSLQTQKDLLSKNYDEKNRNNQRKLRDIKETIDRLREKLNTTTNKIVGNDIIKQQADEVKKQQLVEKEMEEENNRYLEDCKKFDEQIEGKKAEIEKNRQMVENTLINDFKDYSDKIYDELKNIADNQVNNKINDLIAEKNHLESELEDRERYIIKKDAMYEEKSKEAEEIEELRIYVDDLKKDIMVKDQEIVGANKEVESRRLEIQSLEKEIDRLKKEKYHEVYRYFDTDGVEFFYDEKGRPYYYDSNGKMQYYRDLTKLANLNKNNNNDDDNGVAKVENQIEEENDKQTVKENEDEKKLMPKQKNDDKKNNLKNVLSKDEIQEINNALVEETNQEKTKESKPKRASKEKKNETEIQLDNLEKEIENQNKILEEQYKSLQENIQAAEEVAKEQVEVEKPKEKKASNKKASSSVENKPKSTSKSKSKDKYVFNVRKNETDLGNASFDLSGFNNLEKDKDKDK